MTHIVEASSDNGIPALPRRKYVQFSLRTLVGVTFAVAFIAGAYSWSIHGSRLQRQAIDVIASKGGYVWLDRAGSYIDVEFGVSQQEGCGQIQLVAAPRVKEPTFADRDLVVMRHIWRLRRVSFANTRVSPPAIKQFRESNPHLSVSE